MRPRALPWLLHVPPAAVLALVLAAPAAAEESFSFGFLLESDALPDLDRTSRITGTAGTAVDFDAVMTLTSAGIEGPEGAQGWSCSVWYGGLELVELSVSGTAAAPTTTASSISPIRFSWRGTASSTAPRPRRPSPPAAR